MTVDLNIWRHNSAKQIKNLVLYLDRLNTVLGDLQDVALFVRQILLAGYGDNKSAFGS